MVEDFGRYLVENWPAIMAARLAIAAAVAVGLLVGWGAVWIVLKERLTHYKELVEHYEKRMSAGADADHFPALKPKGGKRIRWVIAGLCALFVIAGFVLWPKGQSGTFASTGQESPTPQADMNISTSLRLQFNAKGKRPEEIEAKNIEWTFASPTEMRVKPDDPVCSLTNLNRPAYPACPLLLGTAPIIESNDEWIIFLTFLKPTKIKELKLDSHGSDLPKWDVHALSTRKAYIWLHGNVTNTIVDITAIQN